MAVRIRIREQLCLLIGLTSLLSLMVLAVATWTQSHRYITQVRASALAETASMKANTLATNIAFYRDLVQSVSTRTSLQSELRQFNNGNDSNALLDSLQNEISNALAGGIQDTLLLQAAIFPRSDTANQDGRAIVNATGEAARNLIALPETYSNGSQVYLGDPVTGYPPSLYPNYTWSDQTQNVTHINYDGLTMYYNSTLLLGPLYLSNDSALISMSVAINNNTSRTDVLGWLTIVLDVRYLYQTAFTGVGLGKTGEVLIVSPVSADNLFTQPVAGQSEAIDHNIPVNFILPPLKLEDRHSLRVNQPYLPFPLGDYPCALSAWTKQNDELNNAGSDISTHNEQNRHVSCGYAQVPTDTVNWAVIIEQSYGEVVAPIRELRDLVLACIFSVLGAILVVCFPLAHFAVKPIIALRAATKNSILTYEAEVFKDNTSSSSEPDSLKQGQVTSNGFVFVEKKGRKKAKVLARRQFQIPQKVPDRKHLLNDELTDLTSTFNEMSDELSIQYARLEERVKTRTAELEKSRDLARAADESKTLFIANVSHELRTPLNGIIGMCSVAMQEEEVYRIRQSLNIIYKSSDLLMHLLNDLLTFSRNSYGQQLSIEEGTFRLADVGTQIVSIFEKQARESNIELKVVFIGTNQPKSTQMGDDMPEDAIVAKKDVGTMLKRVRTNVLARGPADTGPLREMSLKGDKNRIIQVLMNLVSNSLKFTPSGGMIEVRIRCKGFSEKTPVLGTPAVETKPRTSNKSSFSASPEITTARPLDFEFEVEDTGPGVPEHMRQEIFKPFVQGDLALSRKYGGTGLGLAICAQLASSMGGGIHLKSTVDIGSTFTLFMPLHYTKERVPSVAGSLAAPPGSRRGSARPPSLGSSVKMEVQSTKSPRPPTGTAIRTQPTSARNSDYAGSEEKSAITSQLEQSRIGGVPQPFPGDGKENAIYNKSNGEAAKREREREGEQDLIEARRNQLASIASVEPEDDKPAMSKAGNSQAATPETLSTLATPTPTDSNSWPLSSQPTASSTRPKSPKPPKPPLNLKVLVAEDNKVNQEVIVRMLKLEKVTDVTLAEDGQKALDAVKESLAQAPSSGDSTPPSPFQLIFMDIQMPNMDGIESTKRIRELGFDAPIIALTAFDHETNRDACREAGLNDFVGKPIKRSVLRRVLEDFRTDGT